MLKKIQVLCFDADDTLWINEAYFRDTEKKFNTLMSEFIDEEKAHAELFKITIDNLPLYGYGVKSFVLSMIEAAIRISDHRIPVEKIEYILQLGRDILNQPVVLLNHIENILGQLQNEYRLIVATKGDLLEQERKLKNSGLEKYFHHIEIMSEKDIENYRKLIKHLDINPDEFLMIGNSMKSDILPVLELGAYAVYIPCDATWVYEHAENHHIDNPKFREIDSLTKIPEIITTLY